VLQRLVLEQALFVPVGQDDSQEAAHEQEQPPREEGPAEEGTEEGLDQWMNLGFLKAPSAQDLTASIVRVVQASPTSSNSSLSYGFSCAPCSSPAR